MQSINKSMIVVAYLPSHTTGLVVFVHGNVFRHAAVGCNIHGKATLGNAVETNGNVSNENELELDHTQCRYPLSFLLYAPPTH
jgi:hypothetical protein